MKTISVTAKHIESGKPGELCFCPIALAVSEAFNGAKVWIGMRSAIWLKKDFPCACVDGFGDFRISNEVAEWAVAFDEGREVLPFTFELKPV